MRYVWRADGWQKRPERPWRNTFVHERRYLPEHYWRHQWGFFVRRWLLPEEVEWKDLSGEERQRRNQVPPGFMAQVVRKWDAYDRSVGMFLEAHLRNAPHVPGVYRVHSVPAARLYGTRKRPA